MSSHYVIWKESGDYPWRFEGDAWGDTGAAATFEEAIGAVSPGPRVANREAAA